MFDHTGIVVTDLARARAFYDAIARPLGLLTVDNSPESFLLGKSKADPISYLWVGTQRPSYWTEGSRAGINQMHVALIASSKDAVQAFHKAGIAAGGTDHGAPGPREGAVGYYGAFLLDPDGHNIEAAYRDNLPYLRA
jgi:catechol 2,3-dioxygenase-like lactoylglutathione lyase family enzyme